MGTLIESVRINPTKENKDLLYRKIRNYYALYKERFEYIKIG